MSALMFPRRVLSTTTSIAVISSDLPSWVPGVGQFASVSQGTPDSINPDVIDPNYPGLWGDGQQGWRAVWSAYGGGIYAPTVGTLGSILLFNGGHLTWDGCDVVQYDIADRNWYNFTYPIPASCANSIVGGVVVSTPSLDSDTGGAGNVNDRVGLAGHYIKYADGTPIVGAEVTGNSTTIWYPFPIHTNCGTAFLPADAGGGTLGSLVVVGHDQTGLYILPANGRIFKLDLASKIWSAQFTNNFSTNAPTPALEYDSFNKVIWVVNAYLGPLISLNYATGTKWQTTSPSVNSAGCYANACFMANRKLLIMANRDGAGTTGVMRAIDVSSYVHGTTTTLPYYALNIATAYPTGWPTSLFKTAGNGGKDRLEYCELDGCCYYLDAPDEGTTTCNLFKLTPPAVGQEQSGTWVWSSESITVKPLDSLGFLITNGSANEPTWGGKTRFIPQLKSMIVTAQRGGLFPTSWPVQAVRSSSWT